MLDNLTSGTSGVFNRHYGDYSLALLNSATLYGDIMKFVTVIHLKDFSTKLWATQLGSLQRNPVHPKGNVYFDIHLGFDFLEGHRCVPTKAVAAQLCSTYVKTFEDKNVQKNGHVLRSLMDLGWVKPNGKCNQETELEDEDFEDDEEDETGKKQRARSSRTTP